MIKKTENKKKNKEIQNKINLFLLKYFGFIIALIVILLLYAGYFYVIRAKQDNIKSNIEVANENKESAKIMLEKKLEKLKEYRLAYESVSEAEKKKINIMIPENNNKNLLFTNMEAFILRQGLVLDSIDINEECKAADNLRGRRVETSDTDMEVSVSGVDELKIDLSISGIGSYEHFKKVLSAFENNLQILDIDKLDCNLEEGVLDLSVTAYYLKDK
ncbi:hypothetical protein KAU09_02240 [Candidatus Parcubacteria bacterium]|nr:hypothetical protein [Candidatus Parcubacteria bacterium]